MKLVPDTDPILNQICIPVSSEEFGPDLVDFCKGMISVMISNRGIGLAAPQVGDNRRITIVSYNGSPMVVINPIIKTKSPRRAMLREGCLSFPGVSRINTSRSKTVQVSFLDIEGNPQTKTFNGIEAVCVQHEIDHLNGITIK